MTTRPQHYVHEALRLRGQETARENTKKLARPLNLAAMSDLRSGVQSRTQEILHLPGGFEIGFLKNPHKWTEELRTGK